MTADLVSVVYDRGDWPEGIDVTVRRAAKHVMRTVDEAVAASGLETSVVLTDDASVRDLNHRYRGQAKPTNVLSFPIQDPYADRTTLDQPDCLGEIYLAAETITREAAAEGKSMTAHTTHLVVHGMLHLLGFDHLSESQAQIMESWETRLLAELGVADPYAGDAADLATADLADAADTPAVDAPTHDATPSLPPSPARR